MMRNRLLAAAKSARAWAAGALKKQPETPDLRVLSTDSALKIIYFMMAADGLVFYSEEEKFDAIGREIDPSFAGRREEIVRACRKQLEKAAEADSYAAVIQEGVEASLLASKPGKDSFITPKLLVWDLLTVAFSEESYDEDERDLLTYIVRRTDVDEAVFHELETLVEALMEAETADGPAARKDEILARVQELIAK